jgi:asparagine synthetase B (glutamine-hydrolysing)
VLESLLRIANFYWAGERFRPPVEWTHGDDAPQALRGQYAFALSPDGDEGAWLVRDALGINKLFFAIHQSGTVLAANYLIDLVERGVPCESVYSVPAGHVMRIDTARRQLGLTRYVPPRIPEAGASSLAEMADQIRAQLETWFGRLAQAFHGRRIAVALSGGLDSGVIAALARRYFERVTAYTYSYRPPDGALSEDAAYAQRLAEFLEIPFRLVPASAEQVLGAIERALVYGQDWRDFNVHCAIVNELLGRAIAGDVGQGEPVLVLTGDLNNEFFADYAPVVYGTHEYYTLPRLDRRSLRHALVRGLDTGDREVGILGGHGLDVIQPYGLLAETLLAIPAPLLGEADAKQQLGRAAFGDLLPDWIFKRLKVRAQVGTSGPVTGILAVLAESGRDAAWLRQAFRGAFRISGDAFMNSFIRAGVYRSLQAFPPRVGAHGYLA